MLCRRKPTAQWRTRAWRLILRLISLSCLVVPCGSAFAQEPPYFVTYSSALEEPGNLEIENQNIVASPKNASLYFAPTVELEYGVTGWWTAEAYLQGQSTQNDSTILTGYRFESRFRPLPREYWINPVLYVEYENVNGADKSYLEVTGNTTVSTKQVANKTLRLETERSIEGKLILSSNVKGWNVSENIIAEKAVNDNESWEFGYALAAARPLALSGSSKACIFCRQNLSAGAELFGGLGSRYNFGLKQTEQYAGPTVALQGPGGTTLKFGPEFGLNDNSAAVLWRFGMSYEIQQFRDWFRRGK